MSNDFRLINFDLINFTPEQLNRTSVNFMNLGSLYLTYDSCFSVHHRSYDERGLFEELERGVRVASRELWLPDPVLFKLSKCIITR